MVATGGNWRRIDGAQKPQKQAKSVAAGCDQLPEKFHGREEVTSLARHASAWRPFVSSLKPALAVDFRKGGGSISLNAKSREPEGPQDLTT